MKSHQFATTAGWKAVVLVLLGLLTMLAATARVGATMVTALGVDTTSNDAWRNTTVAKNPTFDPNGDNVYGSDGYYVESGGTLLSSLPSYIGSVTVSGGVGPYPNSTYGFNDPTITGGEPDIHGIWYTQTDPQGMYWDFFTITLAKPATFVLTTLLDTHVVVGIPSEDPFTAQAEQITGTNHVTLAATTAALTGLGPEDPGHPIYAFFELSGNAGDTFTVALETSTQGSAPPESQWGAAETSGLGFETVIPEPAAILLFGVGGLVVLWWRRRNQPAVSR